MEGTIAGLSLNMYNMVDMGKTENEKGKYHTSVVVRSEAHGSRYPCGPGSIVLFLAFDQGFDSHLDIYNVTVKVAQAGFHVLDLGLQNV